MSETEDDSTSDFSNAIAVEICAADWVATRRNRKDWTDELQAGLDVWLAQSLAHRVAYLRIDATWHRTDRLAALRRPIQDSMADNASRKAIWKRIVAMLGIVAITSVIVGNYITRPRPQLIETPKGGQERLTLADGSQLELNTDTAVLVDLSAHARAVELVRGEAYFQIKHDATRPFEVMVAKHRIVDLGTKFLVRMTAQAVQVALVEGSARLENESNRAAHAVVLSPGDVAVATADATRISRKSRRDLSESLAWQRGSIVFHNERLSDAAAEFNRYGGPQLTVADRDAAKLLINGTFPTTGAEDFAGITHEIFGLRVEHQNGNLVLSR